MISLDVYVVEFIQGNFLSVTIFLGLLKGIANMTENVWDNKISTLLGQMVRLVKHRNLPPTGSAKERVKAKIGHNV